MDAGRKLADSLTDYADQNPFVLGMARGGVVLAGEVARKLDAQVDVVVVRKIGAPMNPEYGVGAVAPLDVCVFDNAALSALRLTPADLRPTINRELAEIDRRAEVYRSGRGDLDVSNRTVILVDDGLATGITAVAAARYVKRLGARYVVFAAPVCSGPGAQILEDEVEKVVCLEKPETFFAVGMWYEDFSQVEDEEVLEVLEFAKRGEYLA